MPRRLLLSLDQGSYEHFLDPTVNRAWKAFVSTSVQLATRRLSGRFRERDISAEVDRFFNLLIRPEGQS